MQGHLVRTAMFVPHITPARTICPAAPGEFLLLSFTTSGGMFYMAFSTLKALLPDFFHEAYLKNLLSTKQLLYLPPKRK